MPIYVYRVVRKDGADEAPDETFEVRQSIHDAPFTTHPQTGEPVTRVLCAPTIKSGILGNSALTSAGMTKYVKTSDGTYERQAGGAGPKHINPHDY